jgi:DNA-binding SARP family transcriptional activator
LRDAGLDARTILSRAGTGYRITVPADSCDVQRFRARKESGLRAMAAGRFSVASEVLSSALAQWRGTALADLQGLGFADAFATALDDERIGVVEARAQAEIAQGRADGVIAELAELAGKYPLREPLWEQLITALYVSGRQSDALEALRRLRLTLADELGIDPAGTAHPARRCRRIRTARHHRRRPDSVRIPSLPAGFDRADLPDHRAVHPYRPPAR